MTKKELVDKLNEELDDNDVIDFLSIGDREDNELDFDHTSRGYFVQSHYSPPNYKHLNDPSRD